MTSKYILSLDVGTTSVKTLVIKHLEDKCEIVTSFSQNTDADIKNLGDVLYSEQNVIKIVKTVDICISKISKELDAKILSLIEAITVCGQMHGCLLWKQSGEDLSGFNWNYPTSNLITWQDSRCDCAFLRSLPLSSASATPLSSGFGCASLIWLLKNRPDVIEYNSCCGTIADYIVFTLCGLQKPVMSTHNAASWGYFNMSLKSWDLKTLEKLKFPHEILPEVVSPVTVAGKLKSAWHGVPQSTEVYVALGDLQCSVLSCQPGTDEAVINLSTSAQISKIVAQPDAFHVNNSDPYLPPSFITLPYFGDSFVKTSASLNGGSVFASFVEMLLMWTRKFVPEATRDDIYREIFHDSYHSSSPSSQLQIDPSINGERHEPNKRGTIRNISQSDLQFGVIFSHLAKGIIENLRDMFQDSTYSHIWACGGVFKRNILFREELVSVFQQKTVSFERDCDAAYGAALSLFQGESKEDGKNVH